MKKRRTPDLSSTIGLTVDAYKKLAPGDKHHHMRCPSCGRYFDMRRLDQVVAHSFMDHDAGTSEAREFSGIRGEPVDEKDA
jgi:hypothetical protein